MLFKRVIEMAIVGAIAAGGVGPTPALAQETKPIELGAQVTSLRLGEFDTTDLGVGVQGAWRLSPLFAIDGALSVFPPGDQPFTARVDNQGRLLGLVGVRSGVRHGPLELFGRVRPGFLRFAEQDRVVCILIAPQPLSCLVLGGYTAFATDIGGGARFNFLADRMQVTFDIGDLLVRYSPEAFRRDRDLGEIKERLVGHSLLFSAGLNWRF
jgi:hypothetical protein